LSKAKNEISSIRTVGAFLNGRACSDTLFYVLNRAYDHPSTDEERAAMPLAGGIMMNGYQCGMIWGATFAAGAEAYRRYGAGPQAETRAIMAAQRLVESFAAQNHHTNCLEITELDKSSSTMQMIIYFLVKGGSIRCFHRAGKYAPVAFDEINTALSDKPVEVPPDPVSCAAMLARKMGVSDLHAVMAAGLAGGIGLSGGACGTLGAAIWIKGLNSLKAGAEKLNFQDANALETIDRFLKCTNYDFECPKIVGRKFESVADHAGYVCNGGCAKVIEVLAGT
jgi:hypothetical protein